MMADDVPGDQGGETERANTFSNPAAAVIPESASLGFHVA
jgi:hypothetical protein